MINSPRSPSTSLRAVVAATTSSSPALIHRHGSPLTTVPRMYDRVNIDSTINMSRRHSWMSAADASALLGVSRTTLYAYVSRGFVRSQATPGPSRERRYSRDDVERLRRRTEERRNPDKAVAHALQWGMPVLESAITLIDGHRLYYRGHDALALARTRSIAEVASLIWTGRFDALSATGPTRPQRQGHDISPFAARAQSLLASASARRCGGVRPATGERGRMRLAHSASPDPGGNPPSTAADRTLTIDQRLARAWRLHARGTDILRSALILCADHELNVSSFTARCVASAGSDPYAVVIAGLSALMARTRRLGRTCRGDAAVGARRARPAARPWRPGFVGVSAWTGSATHCIRRRSARRDVDGHASRAIRDISGTAVRRELRAAADRAHPRKAKSGLCAGRRRARAPTPCRLAAHAVCDRSDDRLDRPRDRAVRDRSADSTAREIRRRAAVDLRRHSRHMSPVIDEGWSDPDPTDRAHYQARRRDTSATRASIETMRCGRRSERCCDGRRTLRRAVRRRADRP